MRVLSLLVLASIVAVGIGCRPTRSVSKTSSQVGDASKYFVPVTRGDEWSGQVFLPARDARLDNTVFLRVASAPESAKGTIGKLVRLSWLRGLGSATQYTPNIVFNSEELAKAQQSGNVVPTVLNGWDKVGPLESLAAARCRGNFSPVAFNGGKVNVCDYDRIERIFVKVKATGFDAATNTLRIGDDPTVVAGTHYALVKNLHKTDRTWSGGNVKVYEANVYQNGAFDTDSSVEFGVEEEFGTRPNFTFNEIDRSPAGSAGWYLYADTEPGENGNSTKYIAHAIEPRALIQVVGEYGKIEGTSNGEQFLTYQEDIPPANPYLSLHGLTRAAFTKLENNYRKVRIFSGATKAPLSDANPIETIKVGSSQHTFRKGEVGLVVHLFHWITDPAGKKDIGPLGLVTGHYSYGLYEVVREPITNELQFDVVYRQVYGQGPDAVISSKISRSEYMGNFRRGWSNSIATSDVLVRATWLDNTIDTSSGGQTSNIVPLKIFDDTLSLMLHAYRTGSGDGISSIAPWASCVQDSSQALFIAMKRIEKSLIASRGASYCQNAEYGRICGLADKLRQQFDSSEIFANAPVRGDWVNNAINLEIRRTNEQVENGYEALQSYKTALPRNAFNLFLGAMLKQGANLVLMDNVQIGGYWSAEQKSSGFRPVPATTIVEVVKAMLAQGGQIPQQLSTNEFVQFILKREGVSSLRELNNRLPAR